jgi:hypothetical protein
MHAEITSKKIAQHNIMPNPIHCVEGEKKTIYPALGRR